MRFQPFVAAWSRLGHAWNVYHTAFFPNNTQERRRINSSIWYWIFLCVLLCVRIPYAACQPRKICQIEYVGEKCKETSWDEDSKDIFLANMNNSPHLSTAVSVVCLKAKTHTAFILTHFLYPYVKCATHSKAKWHVPGWLAAGVNMKPST